LGPRQLAPVAGDYTDQLALDCQPQAIGSDENRGNGKLLSSI
jgi:hypothetical protein